MPLISYNNQGGSYRKLSNKSTQYDVRVFNTVIRTVVAEDNQKKKTDKWNWLGYITIEINYLTYVKALPSRFHFLRDVLRLIR